MGAFETELQMEGFLVLRTPPHTPRKWGNGSICRGVSRWGGGREQMDSAPSAAPGCVSRQPLPPSSSAISRGSGKVISDLTPKSQLLVAAPRSGMSAAPSWGLGQLNPFVPERTGTSSSGASDPSRASRPPPQRGTLDPTRRPQKGEPAGQ